MAKISHFGLNKFEEIKFVDNFTFLHLLTVVDKVKIIDTDLNFSIFSVGIYHLLKYESRQNLIFFYISIPIFVFHRSKTLPPVWLWVNDGDELVSTIFILYEPQDSTLVRKRNFFWALYLHRQLVRLCNSRFDSLIFLSIWFCRSHPTNLKT